MKKSSAKKIFSTALASAMILGVGTSAAFAQGVIVKTDAENLKYDTDYFEQADYKADFVKDLGLADGEFFLMLDDETVIDSVKYLEARTENKSGPEAIEFAKGAAPAFKEVLPSEEGLEVVEVSAISETVDVDGTLEFAINEETEAADLEELVEEGYEVEFLASKKLLKADDKDEASVKNTTGKVKAEAGNKFEYQVVVTKDGEEVAKSDRKEVEVQDYSKTALEITKVEVKLGDQEITDGQLALNDKVSLTVKGLVKGNDEEVTFEDAKFKTNRPAVLAVDETGKVTPNAKGTATVTVKVGELTKEVELKVGDKRKVDAANSTIDKDEISVAAGKSEKVTVELKDQYGLAIAGTVIADNADENAKVITEQATGVQVKKDNKDVIGKYEFTLKAVNEKAEGNVVVKAEDVTLGKISVTVLEAGEVDHYKLTAEDTEYDIKGKTGENKIVETILKAYDNKGLETELPKGLELEYVSSNENVLTVDNTGEVTFKSNVKAGDKATVSVKEVKGAFKDTIAELEFTVVDTTPELTTVKFVDDFKVTKLDKVIDLNEIVELKAEDTTGNAVEVEVVNSENEFIIQEKVKEDEIAIKLATLTIDKDEVQIKGADGDETKFTVVGKGSLYLSIVDENNVFQDDLTITVDTTVEELNTLTPTLKEDKSELYQIVSIPWSELGDLKDKKFHDVFDEFKIELLNDEDEVLATGDYVFKDSNEHHKLSDVSGISFRYWAFERDDNFDGKSTSWVRSGYVGGIEQGADESKPEDMELATKVKVTMKTVTGEEVVIISNNK